MYKPTFVPNTCLRILFRRWNLDLLQFSRTFFTPSESGNDSPLWVLTSSCRKQNLKEFLDSFNHSLMGSLDLCFSACEPSCRCRSALSVWHVLWRGKPKNVMFSQLPSLMNGDTHTLFCCLFWGNSVHQAFPLDTSCRINQGRIMPSRLCDAVKARGSQIIHFIIYFCPGQNFTYLDIVFGA